jgi:hypothetical protein
MIKLGQKVKDKVTDFTGIAVSRIEFLNGCVQVEVMPKASKPKKGEAQTYPDGKFIDEEQLEIVKGKKSLKTKKKDTGGGIRAYPCSHKKFI